MTDQQRDVIDAESQPNQHLDGLMKENSNVKVQPRLASHLLSHNMARDDPANPLNWPLHRKIYTSAAGWMAAYAVAFGLTCITAGKMPFIMNFGLDPKGFATEFTASFSLYLFGVTLAPIWTPHVAERTGRSIVYLTSLPICALFILGAGLSHSIPAILVCRFLAGLFGGPCLVLIEGTFADIWSATTTNTYYACLGTAPYFGAGSGALVGGYLVKATNGWRWTQYCSTIVLFGSFIFALGMCESYQREIPRRLAKTRGSSRAEFFGRQAPAQSGTTFATMITVTVTDPILMVFSDPVTMLATLFLLFNFAVVFQWFFTIPAALGMAGFTIDRIGLAFLTAIIGSALGAVSVIIIDQFSVRSAHRQNNKQNPSIEARLIPSMIGIFLVTAALFWIGFTVNPHFKPIVPIIGTAVYVWGNSMIIMSVIPYLFDVYPPAATLSAITATACARILFAGVLTLGILPFFNAVTPQWALCALGFISVGMWPIPFVLFVFGKRWRERSRFGKMTAEMMSSGHESDGGSTTMTSTNEGGMA